MLEKIGLPAKPSLRGSNWVVDASHCQGCSSQFTFINRKHHCRRCGGIYCNSCTQQRMILRGQGDSPVRICEPCKKLEEAARFDMRYGYKSRAGRGGSRVGLKYEDQVSNKNNVDGKLSSSLASGSTSSEVSGVERAISNASSNFQEENAILDNDEDMLIMHNIDGQSDSIDEIGTKHSPDELRQQAVEEKTKYKILKGENKPEEALRAFKRGKELERQAKALEISLRKSHKKALSSSSLASTQKMNDNVAESDARIKLPSQSHKEKDDLVSELRELGWSDADLHDADKKPAKMSLEGELSILLGEGPHKSIVDKGTGGIDKTQVFALKRKALALKREGRLAEAKEELKKAKVLEKQLEEQEFLAGAEDSDDELLSLIQNMDDDKEDDLLLPRGKDAGFDFGHLLSGATDLGDDGHFDVTEEDMDDPDMAAVLKSWGWTEDFDQQEVNAPQSVIVDVEAISNEILSLKKEAVNQKRAGNVAEALALLRKAKILEKEVESLETRGKNLIASKAMTQKGLIPQSAEESSRARKVDQSEFDSLANTDPPSQPKSKLMLQKELLVIKKKALTLRREGRSDEAEEELKKGKVLERQLEEMESTPKRNATKVNTGVKDHESAAKQFSNYENFDLYDEDDEDVTEQDMEDPALLSQLENLGWRGENDEPERVPVAAPRKSKAEIQRELLNLKRKALALRRQGEADEAEDILRRTKVLEAQMAAMETSNKELTNTGQDEGPDSSRHPTDPETSEDIRPMQETQSSKPLRSAVEEKYVAMVMENTTHDPAPFSQINNMSWKDEITESAATVVKSYEQSVDKSAQLADTMVLSAHPEIPVVAPKRTKAEIQRELVGLKRKALKLRRHGEVEEAEEVQRMAKALEVQLEESTTPNKDALSDTSRDDKLETVGSTMSQEKLGNLNSVVEVARQSKLLDGSNDESSELLGFDWNGSGIKQPFRESSSSAAHVISKPIGDMAPLIEVFNSEVDSKVDKPVDPFAQSGQLTDLLTGNDWRKSQFAVEERGDQGSSSSGNISHDSSSSKLVNNPHIASGKKSENLHEKEEKTVGRIQRTQADETNSTPSSNSQNNQTSLPQEILARKRKAVSLKREGKLAEAREELRQAKLLEKRLQEERSPPVAASTELHILNNDVSSPKEAHKNAGQSSKPLTSRDRFKLQQESLAHKRQAMKLRREGRTDEADAEFQLAKDLEAQLEESLSSKAVSEADRTDDLGVEDFLDPQLLSALKAIGLHDAEVAPKVSAAPESVKPTTNKNETSNQEKTQLEELIKAEKVKAVNLKRAGKQSEALDALRRAKMYEKKLNSLLPQ